MIFVTGAITKKSKGIPTEDIGMIFEMTRGENQKKYPSTYSRIILKTPVIYKTTDENGNWVTAEEIHNIDCVESVEEIVTQINFCTEQ